MSKKFYRAFEERYYAPREIIKGLRKQYLPFVEPLTKIYENGNTFDLGCGRGEWLELMQEIGFDSYGVDIDDGMLEACYARNLTVQKGDAVKYLKKLDTESQVIVTAFHVVEHISFDDLQIVVQEALRVLKPGGLLIMETPNPENIKVATENFYLDPTHIKPIPSKLLSFLPEFYGYARTKVLRLQESKELVNQKNISLIQVIENTSPDYAVITQKKADKEILKKFDKVFAQDFGISLKSLAEKFENRLVHIETKANEAEAKAYEAQAKANEVQIRMLEAEARAKEAWHNFHIIENSNSWKMTKPLRTLGKSARWFIQGSKAWLTFSPTSRPRRILKDKLLAVKHRINAQPALKSKIMQVLGYFPALRHRLQALGKLETELPLFQQQIRDFDELSPHAKEIYNDLKNEEA